jgi:hypothetical protein
MIRIPFRRKINENNKLLSAHGNPSTAVSLGSVGARR